MLKIIQAIALLLLALSCNNDDNRSRVSVTAACGVGNPIGQLRWLSDQIAALEQNATEDSKYFFISQAKYQGQTVFVYNDCHPLIDRSPGVANCEGVVIGFVGLEISQGDITESDVIYKPKNFACN